ncbi:hypothetical protein HPB52_017194 [Rhipicephalus sanguineus]|uniref:Uncharacterized protein n=1 Tax=Rhipicephalus sanguineus TaxID=34632 RepID=A0A9D4Q179_RHISA|nr:hypothetical protein HPB52_017194 [Rhipicephalus sanguineus]
MDKAKDNFKLGSSPDLTPMVDGADVHTAQSRSHSVLLITIATLALLAAFIATALLIFPKQLQRTYQAEKEPALQCGDEMVPIISLVNATGDPCTDLYRYVCSNAEEPDSSYLPPAFRTALAWELVRDAVSETRRAGGATERASLLRHEFWNWLRLNEGERVADFVHALVKAGNVSTSMTASQIRHLLTEMSLRYALAPFVSSKGSATRLKLERSPLCLGVGNHTVTLAVRAFNDDLNASVEVDDIFKVDKALKTFGERAGGARSVPQDIDKVPFRHLGQSDWQDVQNDPTLPMQLDKTHLSQTDSQRLDELVRLIVNAAKQPAALAYVITCAAINGVEALQPETAAPSSRLYRTTCEFFGICELDDIVKLESMRSTAADKRIRNMFSEVREEVSSAALNLSSLFGGSNVTTIVEQLNSVTLLLPSDIAGLDVPLPDMSFRLSAATAAYLLTYAGSMCQWPYEYRFYDERGLATHDVHVILGIQQLAVLLGPYLVAWLGSRSPPVLRPKATVTLCLMATALACEIKRTGLCWETCVVVGLGPSVAASWLDIKDHVLVVRHLQDGNDVTLYRTRLPRVQMYATMLAWAATGLLVDVYGWGIEWVYSLASALYATAVLVVLLGVDDGNDMQPLKLQGVATARDARLVPELVLRRVSLLLEDTETLSTHAAQFLLEAVAVLNRAVFEMTGPYPCGRMVSSLALIFLFRQCTEAIAWSFAIVAQLSGASTSVMAACGTSVCMSAFASAYRYTAPLRPEFCAGHAFLSFGTTMATAGDFTPPWHRSALAGEKASLFSAATRARQG